MARGRKPRTWVKMDCEGLLRGSINYLLELDGQAVWLKMIALSEVCGGRPGFIEDNEERGLPHEYIAHELHCSTELFNKVLETMKVDGAVAVNGSGSIELVNFGHYQFSEYDRQKPYRQKPKVTSDTHGNQMIADDSNRNQLQSNVPVIQSESESNTNPKEKATSPEVKEMEFNDYVEELRSQYTDLDFDNQLKKFTLYWSEGGRKLKRPKLALTNWMDKAREFKGEKNNGTHQGHTERGHKTTYAERRAGLMPKFRP